MNCVFYFLYFDALTSQAFLTVEAYLYQVGQFLEIITHWGAHLSNANQPVQSPPSNQQTHSLGHCPPAPVSQGPGARELGTAPMPRALRLFKLPA